MFGLVKKVMRYQVNKRIYRGMARGIGLKKLSPIIGFIAGVHAMRKHS